jgi:hypothetical protein
MTARAFYRQGGPQARVSGILKGPALIFLEAVSSLPESVADEIAFYDERDTDKGLALGNGAKRITTRTNRNNGRKRPSSSRRISRTKAK